MVRMTKRNPVPDRSPPGSTRAASCVGLPGHMVTNGLQESGSLTEQPGLGTAEILEAQPKKRKQYTLEENRLIMECYYRSDPTTRGYLKRMHRIWNKRHPEAGLPEQRLADQRRFISRNKVFTQIELEEIKRHVQEEQIDQLAVEISDAESEIIISQNISLPIPLEAVTVAPLFLEIENYQLSERQHELRKKIVKHISEQKQHVRLPVLKLIKKKTLIQVLQDVNKAIETISTTTMKETNQLMYSVAAIVTTELIPERKEIKKDQRQNTSPKWKLRLENKICKLRADVSRLKEMKEKKLKNDKIKVALIKSYHLDTKKIKEVLEEVKQRIVAVSKKIIRFENRVVQFRQNVQFQTNQKRFYQSIKGENLNNAELPNKEQTIKFWKDLWDNPKDYNRNSEWVKQVEKEIEGDPMDDLVITAEQVYTRVKKVKNWSAPGKDELHGFWLKHLTSLHVRLAQHFNSILQGAEIEDWLITGRTHLLMKDHVKGVVPGNYRPITCLPTTFKLLTGIISDVIQNHLEKNKLFPVEQKGNYRNSRGTKDQLLIDKMIVENCKRRKTNLHVAWIDYKKAFDSLPHSWILKCLEMIKVSENIKNFLNKAMKKWNTQLMVDGEDFGQVNIQRGIFQGDSLSPLLFIIAMIPLSKILKRTDQGYQTSKMAAKLSHLLYMDDLKLYGKSAGEIESLLNTVRIYSSDISMEFGLDKCAVLGINRGKIINTDEISMLNGNDIRALNLENGYKYLGILQADNIKHKAVKDKVSKEYIRRVRKIFKSKLKGGNTIKAINTWAIPIIRYTAGVVNWTQAELEALDRKTRKIMTINHSLHPRSDVDRLYLPRGKGGRGILQVQQTVEEEKRALAEYIKNSKEDALKQVDNEGLFKQMEEKKKYRKEMLKSRQERWQQKALHGQYLKSISGKIDHEKTWQWLKRGTLKKETEGLILAAQEQALRTNAIKAKIDKTTTNSKCRLCKEAEETVDHLICGCKKIAQTDYLERHNKVAAMVHWNLCKKYHFPATKKWWEHKPEKIIENDEVKILWDFRLQTDRHLPHNTPDLTVIEKKQVWMIDVAIPGDSRVDDKELEKITKYRDLQIEVERLWMKKVIIVPIIIGALGAIPKDLQHHLDIIGVDKITIHQLQKAALLGTAHILRRYL